MGPRPGHRRAHPLRGRRGDLGAGRGGPGRAGGRTPDAPWRRRRRARPRLVLHRHGQAGGLRAQLFQRHRRLGVFRSRPAAAGGGGRAAGLRGPPDAAALRPDAGAHGRGLRLPHGPAAAARSGLDPGRRTDPRGDRVLRKRRPELGAGGLHQGAALRRRPGRRRGVPGRAGRLRLAQEPRLRGYRRHPLHQAPDPCPQGRRAGVGQGRRPEARPRRHPRDRVLRPDPAADPRRPQSGAAQPPHARRPGRAHGDGTRGARNRRGAHRGLPSVAGGRAPHPDAGRRADPSAAGVRRGPQAGGGARRLRQAAQLRRGHHADPEGRQRPLRRALPVGGAALLALRQPGVHRRRGRSGDAGDPEADGVFQPGLCGQDHPRLAPRPHPGHRHRARPRAFHPACAAPAGRRPGDRLAGRRVQPLRRLLLEPVLRGAVAVPVPGAAEPLRADRAGHGLRAAPGRDPGPAAGGHRRHARRRLLRGHRYRRGPRVHADRRRPRSPQP